MMEPYELSTKRPAPVALSRMKPSPDPKPLQQP